MLHKAALIRKPKIILFDWDETLADSAAALTDVTNELLQGLGKPLLNPATVAMNPIQRGIQKHCVEHDIDAEKLVANFWRRYDEMQITSTIFSGVKELLELTGAAQIDSVILSNKPEQILQKEVRGNKVEHHFRGVFGAVVNRPKKPDPLSILHVFDILGIPRRELANSWFVGNAIDDVEAARAMTRIVIGPRTDDNHHYPPIQRYATSPKQITHFENIPDFTKALEGILSLGRSGIPR